MPRPNPQDVRNARAAEPGEPHTAALLALQAMGPQTTAQIPVRVGFEAVDVAAITLWCESQGNYWANAIVDLPGPNVAVEVFYDPRPE